jgi:hypothetical protein
VLGTTKLVILLKTEEKKYLRPFFLIEGKNSMDDERAGENGIKKCCSPLVGRATVEAVIRAAVKYHNYSFGNRSSTGTHH